MSPCRPAISPHRLLPLILAVALLVGACSRPTERPREGAQPAAAGGPVGRMLPQAPPTVAPATRPALTPTAEPTSPPSPDDVVIASPPTGIYPIVSNIQPPPDSALPSGDVVIGARVTGASNLVDIVAFVDGDPVQPNMGNAPTRSLIFSFTRQLEVGPHEVRIQARDDRGNGGAFRWQFTVGPRQRLPTATPPPLPDVAPLPTFVIPELPALLGTPAPSLEATPATR